MYGIEADTGGIVRDVIDEALSVSFIEEQPTDAKTKKTSYRTLADAGAAITAVGSVGN